MPDSLSTSDTTSCLITYDIEEGAGASSWNVTSEHLAAVWNRPEKKIRRRMKKLLKDEARGKNMGKRLEKFAAWITRKGFNPDMAHNFDSTTGHS